MQNVKIILNQLNVTFSYKAYFNTMSFTKYKPNMALRIDKTIYQYIYRKSEM